MWIVGLLDCYLCGKKHDFNLYHSYEEIIAYERRTFYGDLTTA